MLDMNTPAPSGIAREVAAIIDREMTDAGLTQTQLADKAGISQSQVSKLFRGERHMRMDWLYGLTAALDLDLVSVLREAEEVVAARDRVRDAAADRDHKRGLIDRARRRGEGKSLRKSS